MEKPLMDVLLTTFPAHKSQNVGDSLITESARKMILKRNADYNPVTLFREESLNEFEPKRTRSVIAPGFTVAENVYPAVYSLYDDISSLRNFFPIGCSFQHLIPDESSFYETPYSDHTQNFLKFIADNFGPFPCRDQLIVDRLTHFGIPAVYSGDLVLFDEDYIGTDFEPPHKVNSVVFTVQHHLHYLEQSIAILKGIRDKFPDAKHYVAFHSVPSARARILAMRANQLGFETWSQYGDAENLERYNDIDLHIGYRLHGHITFLRKRKPSVLMVEDARAFGFSRTIGTAHGCIDAYDMETNDADETTPGRCMDFVDSQLKTGFKEYQKVFDFIDATYGAFISPHFDKIAVATQLEEI